MHFVLAGKLKVNFVCAICLTHIGLIPKTHTEKHENY